MKLSESSRSNSGLALLAICSIVAMPLLADEHQMFKLIERNRDFPPSLEGINQEKVRLKGLVVSIVDGKKVLLNDLFEASRVVRIDTKRDAFIVYGYLWDRDLHLRCLSYIILARELKLEGRLPPIGALSEVGGIEFQDASLRILDSIESSKLLK